MSVYRRREPDNSSKIARRYNFKQVGRDLFFMLEHRRFPFFPCLREQPGKQSSAHSPSSKYHRSHLFRIVLTAFLFDKNGCQHSSRSPFPAGNHEYTFEDWRERTKKLRGWRRQKSVKKVARIFFSNFVLVYKYVFVLFTFSVWKQTLRHFVTMEIVPLKWKSFLLCAPIPIPVYKPE